MGEGRERERERERESRKSLHNIQCTYIHTCIIIMGVALILILCAHQGTTPTPCCEIKISVEIDKRCTSDRLSIANKDNCYTNVPGNEEGGGVGASPRQRRRHNLTHIPSDRLRSREIAFCAYTPYV
jgi:hypothetical protein